MWTFLGICVGFGAILAIPPVRVFFKEVFEALAEPLPEDFWDFTGEHVDQDEKDGS